MSESLLLESFVYNQRIAGKSDGQPLYHAVTGDVIGSVSSQGVDYKRVIDHARSTGGPTLRSMTVHERARLIKDIASVLDTNKAELYALSQFSGATTRDAWIDIDGGIITARVLSSKARREMQDLPFYIDGATEQLSKEGTFVGRHLCVPREGVSLCLNAFNFPVWGALEKMAPSIIAGVPVIIKPGSPSVYVAHAMMRLLTEAQVLPEGTVQFISGSIGDMFDHLNGQDSVLFTGSLETGVKLRTHPTIIRNNVRFNMETDSMNFSMLGPDAAPNTPEFELFVKEVVSEMTIKSGQRCTAIRRLFVPKTLQDSVLEAINARLDKIVVGDPKIDTVRMGPLVSPSQRDAVNMAVQSLCSATKIIRGAAVQSMTVDGADAQKGAFFPLTVLLASDPLNTPVVHQVEAFGPVTTVMPYNSLDEAIALAKLGEGSLVGSLFTADPQIAQRVAMGTAAYHGRLHIVDAACAKEQTGHGSPLAHMVHGGPGRAGGGEELGGIRSILHHMQRTAVQGSPETLHHVCQTWFSGATPTVSPIHPFRKYFEELTIGDSLLTHRRTVTEADIVNFASLSGDHFYAHLDDIAAKESMFGARVAHGYLILALASGLFVDPAPGPIQANLGIDSLRFTNPVYIGDTIQLRLTVTEKSAKDDTTGVVKWAIEVKNQKNESVAEYVILTQVGRKG